MNIPYELGEIVGIKGEIIEISSYFHGKKDERTNVTEYHVMLSTKEGIINVIVDGDQILTKESIDVI